MTPEYKKKYPNLFQPLTVGRGAKEVRFPNRAIASPVRNVMLVDAWNHLSEDGLDFYGSLAAGGFGGFTLPVNFPNAGRSLIIDDERHTTYAEVHKLQRFVHAYETVSICELNFSGALPTEGKKIELGPSAGIFNGRPVKEISPDEMEQVLALYENEAKFALKAGFDVISLHFGHGFLISNFLSPLTNFRKDEFGGTVENRCRFPLQVLQRVRKIVGDTPIELRLNGTDGGYNKGGITVRDCVAAAEIFSDTADMINISCGSRVDALARPFEHTTHFVKPGYNTEASAEVKKVVKNIPIGVVGGIHTPEYAEEVLAEGNADYIMMGRQTFADPEWMKKVREGREQEIRPCLRCNRCTGDVNRNALSEKMEMKPFVTEDMHCSVNPFFAQGAVRKKLPMPDKSKKVIVVGGGVAGMQAAVTAAQRGHRVTLYEKSDCLGGQLKTFCDVLWFKQEIQRLVKYYETTISKTDIEVHLGTEATSKLIEQQNPDAAIIAVGAEAIALPIPGADRKNVLIGTEVYAKENAIGKKAVIVGGGSVGCETAIFLAEKGHDVTIVEASKYLAANAQLAERLQTLHILQDLQITSYLESTCKEILEGEITISTPNGEKTIAADTVVITVGYRPKSALRDSFADVAPVVRFVGDCRKVALIGDAVEAGFDAGATV